MLGLNSLPNPSPTYPISITQSHNNPKSPFPKFQTLLFKSPTHKTKHTLTVCAKQENDGGVENKDDIKKDNRGPRFNFRWVDLVLDPDPENIVAVGLTGLLTWASVQVLWQLFLISLAILVAAVKYSFIAAILIFILITLL